MFKIRLTSTENKSKHLYKDESDLDNVTWNHLLRKFYIFLLGCGYIFDEETKEKFEYLTGDVEI